MAEKFHWTDIVHGKTSNWIFTIEGWVEILKSQTIKDVNKNFSPAIENNYDGPHIWWVISSKFDRRYKVTYTNHWYCECDGCSIWRKVCSHIQRVKGDFI